MPVDQAWDAGTTLQVYTDFGAGTIDFDKPLLVKAKRVFEQGYKEPAAGGVSPTRLGRGRLSGRPNKPAIGLGRTRLGRTPLGRTPSYVEVVVRVPPAYGVHKFAVKAPFTEGEHTEFMWIMVTALEGDQILGTLENEPVEMKRLRYGSKVSVRCADLNDWVVSDGQDVQAGGFTIKVFEDMR